MQLAKRMPQLQWRARPRGARKLKEGEERGEWKVGREGGGKESVKFISSSVSLNSVLLYQQQELFVASSQITLHFFVSGF